MHIRFTNHPHLQRYHNDDYMPDGYWITSISSEGVAQVKQDVGEALIAAFEHIEPYESQ